MSICIYFIIDFGSIYIKLIVIDLDKKEIVVILRVMIIVKIDVLIGFNEVFEILENDLKNKLKSYEIVKKVVCFLVVGGLKIIVIGLVLELIIEVVKKVVLSLGVRVIKIYVFNLIDKDIEEIFEFLYDMLFLIGGINGGNREYILNNVKILVKNNIEKFIVVVGNEEVFE